MSIETDVRAKKNEIAIKEIQGDIKELKGKELVPIHEGETPFEIFKKESLELVETIANRLIALEESYKGAVASLNTLIQRMDRLEKHPTRLKKKRKPRTKAKKKAA